MTITITIPITIKTYEHENRCPKSEVHVTWTSLEPLASSLDDDHEYEYDYDYDDDDELRARNRCPMYEVRARSHSRQAGGTASGSERGDGPAATIGRNRDAISSRWRQRVSRDLASRCTTRGHGWPF